MPVDHLDDHSMAQIVHAFHRMAVFTALFLFFVCLLGNALCQVHLGPIEDQQQGLECYSCDERHVGVPQCLDTPTKCNHDEVCEITYGPHIHTRISCKKAAGCEHDIANPTRNCTGGGVEFHKDQCKMCCTDTKCVSDITSLLRIEDATSKALRCPGDCQSDHLELCVDHLKRCLEGQFCEVTVDGHGKTKGECKDDHGYQHCTEELSRHPCPGAHKCYWDCCLTNECLEPHFGSFLPSTTPMPTTAAPNSLWTNLNGKCEDQLVGGMCQQLMASQDICHDRLALSLCPQSCGLCDAVNSVICNDTVLNNGCQTLKVTNDICSSDMAIFVCPKTCDLCTKLINSVITSLIEGTSNSTDMPSTLLPPSAVPSNYSTFDCNDLDKGDCVSVNQLCGSSLMKVVCPDECKVCSNTVQTSTSTASSTTSAATSDAPTTAILGSSAPTTPDLSTILTTTIGTPGTTKCPDQDAVSNCYNLIGICDSVIATTVCPNFCRFCE